MKWKNYEKWARDVKKKDDEIIVRGWGGQEDLKDRGQFLAKKDLDDRGRFLNT